VLNLLGRDCGLGLSEGLLLIGCYSIMANGFLGWLLRAGLKINRHLLLERCLLNVGRMPSEFV